MSLVGSLALLLAAAMLEAGGDALVRLGLHNAGPSARAMLLAAGAATLFPYGVAVNAPAWDFGRLLGVYVTLFFLVAQAGNLLVFGVRPAAPVLVGGTLIMSGGLVIALWRP